MRAQDVRQAIAGIVKHGGEELNLGIADDGIELDGQSLMSELVTLDALIDVLKLARLATLRYERALGASWGEIERATGTHASTWRFRHDRGVLGA